MFIKTILRDLAGRVYYEIILMCWWGWCAGWAGDGNLELAFCSSSPDLERSYSWPSYARDQPPLKLVTSGAGWCNLVAREVSPPHLRTLGQESMLSQCSVSEMRVSAAPSVRVSGGHIRWSTCRVTDNRHVPSAQTCRYTRDKSDFARTIQIKATRLKLDYCDVIVKERACLICAVLSGELETSHCCRIPLVIICDTRCRYSCMHVLIILNFHKRY